MKIAILGYGKMGKAIEKIAQDRGHLIVLRITSSNQHDLRPELLSEVDVAIEFSTPVTAVENMNACLKAGVPVVVGTTGWYHDLERVTGLFEKTGSLLYASNFSIGVNILFEVNRKLAHLMNSQQQYDVTIEETHHIHKKDAPSGTAISLADDIIRNLVRKDHWTLTGEHVVTNDAIGITSIRKDEVPGTHIVSYRSEQDQIALSHVAFTREGFALGAVVAAEWLTGRKGVYTMRDVLQL